MTLPAFPWWLCDDSSTHGEKSSAHHSTTWAVIVRVNNSSRGVHVSFLIVSDTCLTFQTVAAVFPHVAQFFWLFLNSVLGSSSSASLLNGLFPKLRTRNIFFSLNTHSCTSYHGSDATFIVQAAVSPEPPRPVSPPRISLCYQQSRRSSLLAASLASFWPSSNLTYF